MSWQVDVPWLSRIGWPISFSSGGAINYAYQLDGVTQSFALSGPLSLAGNWKITQDVYVTNAAYVLGNDTTFNSRVYIITDGSISVRTAQNTTAMSLPAGTFNTYKNMWTTIELEKVGPSLTLKANGVTLGSTTINSADTMFINRIGQNSTAYTNAMHRNFKVYQSGVLTNSISLTQYPYSVQVPTVPAIGANLYTQAVIENPWRIQSGWTANGGGVFTLDNNGDYAGLNFLQVSDMPSAGVVEFEVVEISAGGEITCTENALSGSKFNTVGVKRFYYSDISALGGTGVVFKRSIIQPIRCVIKNIRHYNAVGVPVATIINYTAGGWVQQ